MMDFIERLRAKPAQTRKQIALGVSASVTALIAVVWFTAFSASGTLAEDATLSAGDDLKAAFSSEDRASLLGAIGALTAKQEGSIQVVGTRASSTVEAAQEDERTVIPF